MEVPDEVKRARRKYHSPLRADQAEQTRRRVLEAAFDLFADRGYAGTTIAAVAERAGVSPETIYLSVGGKRGLLEGVIETAIAGRRGRARPRRTTWWASVAELPGAPDRLARMVEYSCGDPRRAPARSMPSSAERRTRRRSPRLSAGVSCTIG